MAALDQASDDAQPLSLAERLYGKPAQEQAKQEAPATLPPTQPADEEPETLAERLFDGGGTPPPDGDYLPQISGVFDDLSRRARLEGADDDLASIEAGRAVVNTTLQDLGVGAPAAQELSIALAGFHHAPASDERLEAMNERTHQELRDSWGRKYDANLAYARAGYLEAVKRVPWLKAEIENGSGSVTGVINHFAAIGRRLARKEK